MADAVISALVSNVSGILISAVSQEFGQLKRLDDDISALKNTSRRIQAVLHDPEVKQRENEDIKEWLKDLRSASLEVENVLDEVSTEAMLRRLHKERGIIYRVRAFFSSDYNRLIGNTKIAHKVKKIRRKLDDIYANGSKFNLTPTSVSGNTGIGSEMLYREKSSFVNSSKIYGRDAEREMIAQKICNKDIGIHDVDGVPVYAIWGMGGVGKTTLAQLVYNHEMVKTHFELKFWVYVSDVEIKNLTRRIIKSIVENLPEDSQMDALLVRLQKKLQGKRFFIVLDDVWIVQKDMENWEELSKALSCGAEGSIVMVTARYQTTSRMMAKVSEFQHEMGFLSKEDSWLLFKKYAFADGREGGNISELEPIGKEIVEKCKGLPLAVKALGSLMWSKSSKRKWECVKDSDIWDLQENNILPALKLSYDNLFPHLKRCFAYCCLFPKGYEMDKELLIELWMANGFIPPSGDLHVAGELFFDCLVWRSFFIDVKHERTTETETCKMHDLMHDLARYVMRHDCSIIDPGKELITPDEVLHFSSSCEDFLFSKQDLGKLRSLRSIFIFAGEYKGSISQIVNHVYLRVLYLEGVKSTILPESICKLKHLRYLNISGSEIEVLPESIIYLQNLQVLLLHSCRSLHKLPKGMRYMRNLQHLGLDYCKALEYMPVGMKELASLRRLSNFVVGNKSGARLGELRDLNLLGWELTFRFLANVRNLEDAKSANLKCKKNIKSLTLNWSGSDTRENQQEMSAHDEEVLEGLEPNPSLKKLAIYEYMGKKISPSWMVNLGNLVKIFFSHCENCEYIPPLGKLPRLRDIYLSRMGSLKCFHDDENTTSGDNILFPSLQELVIYDCPNLVSFPSNLPKLEELRITLCEQVSLPSNLPKLKTLWLRECDKIVSLPNNPPELMSLHIMECERLSYKHEIEAEGREDAQRKLEEINERIKNREHDQQNVCWNEEVSDDEDDDNDEDKDENED